MFPGYDPRCDAGGCQKFVLTERQSLFMPAGVIHRVGTHSESVALGVNFVHRGHLLTAARVFRNERNDEESFSSCYSAFPILALNELVVHLYSKSKVKLIQF